MIAAELTTGSTTYTAPSNTKTTINSATVTNKTATPRYVTATITPSGGSAINAYYQYVVPAGQTVVLYGLVGQTLMAAGILTMTAEANTALDALISGYETSGT